MGFSVISRKILVETTSLGTKMLDIIGDDTLTHPAWMKEAIRKGKKKRLVYANDLVTLAEVARRTGKARSAVFSWAKHSSFPKPVAKVGHSKVYLWSEVRRWIRWVPEDKERGVLRISYAERKETLRKEANRDQGRAVSKESSQGTGSSEEETRS